MLIVQHRSSHGPTFSILEDDILYDWHGASIFDSPEKGSARGRLEAQDLLPPVWPGKVIGVGRNYAGHAQEHGASRPTQPLIFLKAPSSVIAAGQAILLPPLSQQVEHEAELAVVIGRRCKAVSEAQAWDVVGGVTCANDVTARDLQRSDDQWARAKSFDTFGPLGPYLVTHLSPAQLKQLSITCRVNGQLRQHSSTAQMIFDIPTLIAYVTAAMTLYPGDVILTGTPAGVGALTHGDRVQVEIEQVGVLHNPVAQHSPV
jgi:2-keto-4-pentenoate hydratase/2-oxohepta-3-ene-1,7-dioic acid hydratase in catechol pathway